MLDRPGFEIYTRFRPNAIYMDLSAFTRVEIEVKVFWSNSWVKLHWHLIQSGQTPIVLKLKVSHMHSSPVRSWSQKNHLSSLFGASSRGRGKFGSQSAVRPGVTVMVLSVTPPLNSHQRWPAHKYPLSPQILLQFSLNRVSKKFLQRLKGPRSATIVFLPAKRRVLVTARVDTKTCTPRWSLGARDWYNVRV